MHLVYRLRIEKKTLIRTIDGGVTKICNIFGSLDTEPLPHIYGYQRKRNTDVIKINDG